MNKASVWTTALLYRLGAGKDPDHDNGWNDKWDDDLNLSKPDPMISEEDAEIDEDELD